MNWTVEAEQRIKGLAWYLGMAHSQMLRDLATKKRAALYAEGKRPPLHPRPDGPSHTAPRLRGETFVYRQIRVSPEEKAAILGLAQYLGQPYNQMLMDLAEEAREELVKQGKRPPLHPPGLEGLEDSAQSRWPMRKKRGRTT